MTDHESKVMPLNPSGAAKNLRKKSPEALYQ